MKEEESSDNHCEKMEEQGISFTVDPQTCKINYDIFLKK